MKIDYTNRGFEIIKFEDRDCVPSSLQQSSIADDSQPGNSAIWFGPDKERMHLSREQLNELIPHLIAWQETGSFCIQEPKGPVVQASNSRYMTARDTYSEFLEYCEKNQCGLPFIDYCEKRLNASHST